MWAVLKVEGVVVMTNTYNETLFKEIINSVATVYNCKYYYTPEIRDLKYGLIFLGLGSLRFA